MNKLTVHDSSALDYLIKEYVHKGLTLDRLNESGEIPEKRKARSEYEEAVRNYDHFLASLTETPQEKALEQERLDTKNMVIRGCRLAVVPLLDEGPIHASERSHLCLTLGMALGYLTRSDVP